MKRILVLTALAAACAAGQTFDIYGGSTALQCPTGPKPLFYMEKVEDRWWWCTPEGNVFFVQGVWNVVMQAAGKNKVGGSVASTGTWQPWINRRLSKWGWNAYDTFGSRSMFPSSNAHLVVGYGQTFPTITGEPTKPGYYGHFNKWNFLNQPLRALDTGLIWSGTYAARTDSWRLQDFFDPNYKAYLLADLNATSGGGGNAFNHLFTTTNPVHRAMNMAWRVDDVDQIMGFGGGPDFSTFENGSPTPARRHPHYGLLVLYAPPLMGAAVRTPVETSSSGYTGSESGFLMANPRGSTQACMGAQEGGPSSTPGYPKGSLQTYILPSDVICTKYALAKFLEAKYQTIGALNWAWATGGFYTTFYSSGTVVPDILVGTTNGTNTYTGTIPGVDADNQIAPFSLRVYVNNAYMGADERKLWDGGDNSWCRSTGAAAMTYGHIWGKELGGHHKRASCTDNAGVAASTVNYTTGAITLTFDAAQAAGMEIRVDYVRNGWGRGTGILDESGRGRAWLPDIMAAYPWTGVPQQNLLGSDMVPTSAIKSDLDEFFYRAAYRYLKDMRETIDSKYTSLTGCDPATHQKGICPVFIGPSYSGTWGAPAYAPVLKAIGDVSDVLGWRSWPFFASDYLARMDFIYANAGNKPILTWEAWSGQDDSPFPANKGASDGPSANTQSERGELYKRRMAAQLSYQYPDGPNGTRRTYPGVGLTWWDLAGSDAEGMNWGFLTPNDDPLDGFCPGPGTRLETVPGGPPVAQVVVSRTGNLTSGILTTKLVPGSSSQRYGIQMNAETKIRIEGCSPESHLCDKDWTVTAVTANTATLALDSTVANGTYNEPTLSIDYGLYPCGGSNMVCPGGCVYTTSPAAARNGWPNGSDPRVQTDPDGPYNNRFGDFLGKVREANSYWLDCIRKRPKTTLE